MRSKDERQAAREQRQTEQAQRREERQHKRQELLDESRRRQEARKERKATTTWLPSLGVSVRDGQVYVHGGAESGAMSDMLAAGERSSGQETKLLGPLAGAHAEVAGGRAGRRRSGIRRTADTVLATSALGTVGLLAAASRKATEGIAVVVFADGSYHEKKIRDAPALVRAQADAVRFNALATSATRGQDEQHQQASDLEENAEGGPDSAPDGEPVSPEGEAPSRGKAVLLTNELERLASLHASGVLTDEEFQAAKARILGT